MLQAHVITVGLENALNEDIRRWFRQFNYMPPVPMTAGKVDTVAAPASFEMLLTLVAESEFQNFILIAHGHEDGSGLYLKLAHSRGKVLGERTEHYHLQRLIDLDEGRLPSGERAKLGIDGKEINDLLTLRHKILKKGIHCLEFRACNLGRNAASLDRFREFFGARVVGAPDLHTFFGHGPVAFDPKDVRAHTKRHGRGNWEVYNFPNALMEPNLQACFTVNKANKPDGGHVVAADADVLAKWIKKYVMPTGTHSKGEMPLHGMWVTGKQIYLESEDVNTPLGSWGSETGTRRLVLPLSETYRKHIVYRKKA